MSWDYNFRGRDRRTAGAVGTDRGQAGLFACAVGIDRVCFVVALIQSYCFLACSCRHWLVYSVSALILQKSMTTYYRAILFILTYLFCYVVLFFVIKNIWTKRKKVTKKLVCYCVTTIATKRLGQGNRNLARRFLGATSRLSSSMGKSALEVSKRQPLNIFERKVCLESLLAIKQSHQIEAGKKMPSFEIFRYFIRLYSHKMAVNQRISLFF